MVSRLLQHFDGDEIKNIPTNSNRYVDARASVASLPINIEDEQTILIIIASIRTTSSRLTIMLSKNGTTLS